ncbi:uncharacterized protein A4U43_C07F16740 [Asparagus officinalis]|uniref:Uncharacterized protein n=1 Tax=Asparagus officinalis TaxID=4686 RepID=A0A5P1ECL6_ASPOF|nr:uncharacterized protein A4U43_C07F16740 [Asparagus officinalis]
MGTPLRWVTVLHHADSNDPTRRVLKLYEESEGSPGPELSSVRQDTESHYQPDTFAIARPAALRSNVLFLRTIARRLQAAPSAVAAVGCCCCSFRRLSGIDNGATYGAQSSCDVDVIVTLIIVRREIGKVVGDWVRGSASNRGYAIDRSRLLLQRGKRVVLVVVAIGDKVEVVEVVGKVHGFHC